MRHNPIEDLNLLHCDLVMAAGMINTVTEAAMSGECTQTDIGNSLSILKEYVDRRLDLLEDNNRKLRGLSDLYEDTISDKDIARIFDNYIRAAGEGGQEPEETAAYGKAHKSLDLLPQDRQEPLWRSIREAGAASRKRGFMEGYRRACSMITDMEVDYGR